MTTTTRYIAIEGPDGAGKTTQVKLLCEEIAGRGKWCYPIKQPGGTPVGDAIEKLLMGPLGPLLSPVAERLLFAVDDDAMQRHLWDGQRMRIPGYVVSDRWSAMSQWVYGKARGVTEHTLLALLDAVAFAYPSALVMLIADPATLRARRESRGTFDRMEESAHVMRRVAEIYEEMVVAPPGILRSGVNLWLPVRVCDTAAETHSRIVALLTSKGVMPS
jgi:dTMP kinase